MWPSNLQSDALPSELSPQSANEQIDIRVAYIYFLAGLNLKEVELNSENHAPRKCCFMLYFLLAWD